MTAPSPAWVTLGTSEPLRPRLHCARCGATQVLTLPMALDAFGAALLRFAAEHKQCPAAPQPVPEGRSR